MTDYDELRAEIERHRDEIRLKLHLASMETKDEWAELEKRFNTFTSKAQVQRSGEAIGGALADVGKELRQAYRRFKEAL